MQLVEAVEDRLDQGAAEAETRRKTRPTPLHLLPPGTEIETAHDYVNDCLLVVVTLPDGTETMARFSTFNWPIEERPGDMRIFACQHLTREMVWLPELTRHANEAVRILRVDLVANDPKAAAEHMSRLTDKPIAGLLKDLKRSGLLKDTLVVWAGEFGRTPYAQSAHGRDHNNKGYTIWMAGGGAKGGLAYGATDEFGYQAVENPVHIHDWHATLLHLLGFDHEKLTYRIGGRDFRLTDVAGQVIKPWIA